MEKLDAAIKNAINITFDVFRELRENKVSDRTNLTIPNYRPRKGEHNYMEKKEERISEQELRFLFVEQLFKQQLLPKGFHYSIETPTSGIYKFSDGKTKVVERGKGMSGNFDLTINNNEGDTVAIIEFKAKLPEKHSYKKDFCKLWNPLEGKEILRYFINVFETMNQDTRTSVINKIKSEDYFKKQKGDMNVFVVCKSLKKGQEKYEIEKYDNEL